MLIDDSRIDNLVNKKVIEREGFAEEVTVYTRAMPALDFLADPEKDVPSLILLDCVMPEVDGPGFLDRFRKLPESTRENCRVVMLSNLPPISVIRYKIAYPEVVDWIQKPLLGSNLDRLKAILNEVERLAV